MCKNWHLYNIYIYTYIYICNFVRFEQWFQWYTPKINSRSLQTKSSFLAIISSLDVLISGARTWILKVAPCTTQNMWISGIQPFNFGRSQYFSIHRSMDGCNDEQIRIGPLYRWIKKLFAGFTSDPQRTSQQAAQPSCLFVTAVEASDGTHGCVYGSYTGIATEQQELVGGWANPSEKYESHLGWWNSQYMEK